jgi:Putative zinc-finger
MNCKSLEESIALYAQGDLDPSRARYVELHLKSCASCQRFFKELEASQSLVKALADELPDPASFSIVRQRVMQEVKRRQQARPAWWRCLSPALAQWRPAWAAALAVLVAFGFLLHWQLWRKPAGPEVPDNPRIAAAPPAQENSAGSPARDITEPIVPGQQSSSREPTTRLFARQLKPSALDRLALPVDVEPESLSAEPEPEVEQGSNLEPEPPPPADVIPEPPPPLVIKLITDDPNIIIIWLVDQDIQHN